MAKLTERPWLLAAIALIPVWLVYVVHFAAGPPGSFSTGFLHYDDPYYMAAARAYFADGFHFFYGLPFSPFDATPRIYFQPQTFLLGLLLQLGFDPGWLFAGFAMAMAWVYFRVAIALYRHFVGTGSAQNIVLLAFLWGGGVMVLLGAPLALEFGFDLFILDPTRGGWALNLGRNAVWGFEAYYHAIFLGVVLLLLRRRFIFAFALTAALSASHPFTGLQLVLLVCLWSFWEWSRHRAEAPPVWFLFGGLLLLALHVGYYLVLLSLLSPEHASLQAQWSRAWVLRWYNIPAADILVLLAVVWRLRDRARIRAVFGERGFRLLLVWLVVTVILSNHDLFMAPRQPLHFTRGYEWTALFLMGAPAMVEWIRALFARRDWQGRTIMLGLLALMLLDNGVWFGAEIGRMLGDDPQGRAAIRVTPDEREALRRLNDPLYAEGLIVSDVKLIAYLATAYTPHRVWASHVYNTPFVDQRREEQRRLFDLGTDLPEWTHRKMIAIIDRRDGEETVQRLLKLGYRPSYENSELVIFLRPAPSA